MPHWRVRAPFATWSLAVLVVCAVPSTPRARQEGPTGPCSAEVTRQLRAWAAVGPPRPSPDAGIWHWPTPSIGTWITEVRSAAAPALLLVTPERFSRVGWTERCEARPDAWPRPAADAPRFTDADLAALVASGRPGVIYVWSPNMPLSVDGYRPLAAAAGARGVTVHAVLEPGGDRVLAARARARGGLPQSALRLADSVELWFRDVHLHTPVILVVAHGRIQGDAWPGFRDEAEYGAFLDRALGAR